MKRTRGLDELFLSRGAAEVGTTKEARMNSKWKIIGGALLAAMAIGTAMNYKAIRRYIRISTM